MKQFLQRHEFYVLIVIVLLGIVISTLSRQFLTLENLFDLLRSYSFLGVLAVGVTIVLISGGIDISFTAVTSAAEYVMAVIIIRFGGNMALAIVVAVLVGLILGTLNSLLIHFFRIPTIITTIATLNLYYGLLSFLSRGKWLYNLPEWFRQFSVLQVLHLVNLKGVSYGLSIITVIWFVVLLLAFLILRFTTLGRSIYAMGGSLTSARRVGMNIFGLHMFVYCAMGALAGIAAVIHALLVQDAAPNALVGKELDVIAAVILGGANLAGGSGTLFGTTLGVLLVAEMSNGITLMHISSYWYNVFIGLVILASVSMSAYQLQRRQRQRTVIEME